MEALIAAVVESDHDRITALVSSGTDVDARDEGGACALHHAASLRDGLTCALLLRLGASPDSRDNRGRTPLHHTFMSDLHLNPATHGVPPPPGTMRRLCNLLVAAGADVDARDARGGTPLRWAVGHGFEAVRALVALGADIVCRNEPWQPLMHWHLRCGSKSDFDWRVTNFLLLRGAGAEIAGYRIRAWDRALVVEFAPPRGDAAGDGGSTSRKCDDLSLASCGENAREVIRRYVANPKRYHTNHAALVHAAIGLASLDVPVLVTTIIAEFMVAVNDTLLAEFKPHVAWKIAVLVKDRATFARTRPGVTQRDWRFLAQIHELKSENAMLKADVAALSRENAMLKADVDALRRESAEL